MHTSLHIARPKAPTGVDGDLKRTAEPVIETGVPRLILGGWFASIDPMLVVAHKGTNRRLVQFGESTGYPVCIDADSGEVVQLLPRGVVQYVNSSLSTFNATATAVSSLLPFYSASETDDDLWIPSGEAVKSVVRGIDVEALGEGRMWASLVDSIQMGDFPVEGIIADEREALGSGE